MMICSFFLDKHLIKLYNKNVVNYSNMTTASKQSICKVQSISMPEDLIIAVDKILKDDDISRSDFYKKLVNDYLDKINAEKQEKEMKKAFDNFVSVSKQLGKKDSKSKSKVKWDIVTFMRKDRRSH